MVVKYSERRVGQLSLAETNVTPVDDDKNSLLVGILVSFLCFVSLSV